MRVICFVPEIIEKRKPLAPTARRAGWVGCNIMVGDVPTQGKIEIIKDGKLIDKEEIITRIVQSDLLMVQDISARGWLLDVIYCLNQVQKVEFSLQDIYSNEDVIDVAIQKYKAAELVLEPGEPQFRQLAVLKPKEEASEWMKF